MNTITMTKKIDVTYEQPTISAAWVSRVLGELGKLDLTDHENLPFYLPGDCMRGVRNGQNLIQPMPKSDTLRRWDWGYSVEKDTYGKGQATSVTVWYYRHPDLSDCKPEINLIREYLATVHNLDILDTDYEFDTVDGLSGMRKEYKEVPRWGFVRVAKKPIVPDHFDGCPCGMHN